MSISGRTDTATGPSGDPGFADLIRERVGPDFVVREWLRHDVASAAADHQYVLVTGEPGAGKTSLLAGLAQAQPDWLRYFVRRDSRTTLAGGDVQSFLLAIGHQLARARPELFQPDRLVVTVRQQVDAVDSGGRVIGLRVEDLTVSPFHRTAVLEAEQRIGTVRGSVIGIEIGHASVEPRLLEPDNLAHLALIGPAEVLHAADPRASIVILLDALDELADNSASTSLMRWLVDGPSLPPNVTIIMTSRPHPQLNPLRSRRAQALTEVAIDPASSQVHEDLLGYAARTLAAGPVAGVVSDAGLLVDQFQRDAVRRAGGNFLYLSTYARALTDAAADDPRLAAQLLRVSELPPGLTGLYTYFIDIVQARVAELGVLDIRDPVGPADAAIPAWEGVGLPILGVLAVAADMLSVVDVAALAGIRVWPTAVRTVMARLRWLLRTADDRVALYHSSLGEFLTGEEAHRTRPEWAVDADEWHERIVRHYRGQAVGWAEVPWPEMDRYGLTHLAGHLVSCRAEIAGQIGELVCPGLRRAARARLGTDRHFLAVVDLAAEHLLEHAVSGADLATVVYLGVTRRQLLRLARNMPPAVLGLLSRLGRTAEAVEHATALPPSVQQFEAMREILRHNRSGVGDVPASTVRELLVESALTVSRHDLETMGAARHPWRIAAELVAADDLPRALRLWARANEISGDATTDSVYRAAVAATTDVAAARELIGSIRTDRAGDCLALAERADGDAQSLLDAEACLSEAGHGCRLRGHARLAAAWSTRDTAKAEWHLAALSAGLATPPDDPDEHTAVLVDAATALQRTRPTAAVDLLDRVDRIRIDGRTVAGSIRAAQLWGRWGRLDRTRHVIARIFEFSRHPSYVAEIVGMLREFDPDEARKLLDDAVATMRPEPTRLEFDDVLFEKSDVGVLVPAIAQFDLPRAIELARTIARTTWVWFSRSDRYSVLAGLGHRLLDQGRTDEAREIVEECLRSCGAGPPLLDRPQSPPYRRLAAPGPTGSSTRPDLSGMAYLINQTDMFESLLGSRFYRSPEDLIRAMTPWCGSSANPFSWARTVRALAEAVAERDLLGAMITVYSIRDRYEHTVGLAAMYRYAREHDDREAAELSRSLTLALALIEQLDRCEWSNVTSKNLDDQAFAYVRPDHRARFEAAIRMLPDQVDRGLTLLEAGRTPVLKECYLMAFASHASQAHYARSVAGLPPDPTFRHVHTTALGFARPQDRGQGYVPHNIVSAMAIVRERRIVDRTGKPTAPLPSWRLPDPLYAAVVDLVSPTYPREFAAGVRELMAGSPLPAVAGLLGFAAEIRPGDNVIRQLSAELVDAVSAKPAESRVVALLPFAESSDLRALVDPAALLRDARNIAEGHSLSRVECVDVTIRLFRVLLTTAPGTALRQLYRVLPDRWDQAMAMLEHAAEPVVEALGPNATTVIHREILRGMSCVDPDAPSPDEIDGVATPYPNP